MTDLLGPGAFGAARAVTSRPSLSPGNAPGDPDTWAQDCSSPIANDGTENRAGLFNMLLAQLRSVIRKSGVVADNADDNMLASAIRSQTLNYVTAVGGTANALTVTLNPAPSSLAAMEGLPLRLKIATTNTAAAPTLTVNGFSAAISRADGTEVKRGELAAGSVVELIGTGTGWLMANIFAVFMPPRSQQVFTVSGTFVVPANTYKLFPRVLGGGGGAGGSGDIGGGVAQSSGGGGAGGYAEGWVDVTPGQSIAVTAGAGGAGGTLGVDGGPGGSSSFGAFFSASGGDGGKALIGSPAGGGAGVGIGGSLNQYGGSGTDGHPNNNQYGGIGGSSAFGGGGRPAIGFPGNPGLAPGSGGGGSYGPTRNNGGAGAAGVVIVQW